MRLTESSLYDRFCIEWSQKWVLGIFGPLNMICHQRYPKRHIWAWNHALWAINVSDPSIFVICRRDERICLADWLIDWLCVCKKLKLPLFLSKIGWADFAQILHNNSTPRRNHIFWTAFEYLYPFCIYGGGRIFLFSVYSGHASNTAYCTTVHSRYCGFRFTNAYNELRSVVIKVTSSLAVINNNIHRWLEFRRPSPVINKLCNLTPSSNDWRHPTVQQSSMRKPEW